MNLATSLKAAALLVNCGALWHSPSYHAAIFSKYASLSLGFMPSMFQQLFPVVEYPIWTLISHSSPWENSSPGSVVGAFLGRLPAHLMILHQMPGVLHIPGQ